MDWQSEDFETFLRQFRPRQPRPLPTRRWSAIPLAVSAILLVGVAIFMVQRGQDRPAQQQELKTPAGLPKKTPAAASPGSPRRDEAFRTLSAPARQDGPLRVGGAIRPPTKVFHIDPFYPDEARAAGVQGVVVLEITIGEDGSVIDARVVRSVPLLDQAALDAVGQWLFEPTLLNGEPVEIEMNVVVNFTLPL